jgi:hypothetical protein
VIGDIEIDPAHRLDIVVALDNFTQGDVRHRFSLLSRRR